VVAPAATRLEYLKEISAMSSNAFIGRKEPPSDDDLTRALCSARELWNGLVSRMAEACGIDERDWNSYSVKAGWALRLRRNGRNIVYLSPCEGSFLASFALGDRAVEAARQSDLPAEAITLINASRRYAEGTAVRIEVRTAEEVDTVLKLAAIKLAH
jgi:hypothetical protein